MHYASGSIDTFFFFFSPDVSFDQICNKSEALKNSNIKFLSAPPPPAHVLLPTYLPQTSLNGVVQHAAVKITICLNFTKAFSRSSHFHFQFISSLSRPLCRKCHSSLLFSKWWLTMMKYSKRKLLFCVWGQILHFERSVIESRYSCQRNFCAHNLYLRCFGWRFWSYDVWIHKNLVAARVKAVCTLKKTCFDIPM